MGIPIGALTTKALKKRAIEQSKGDVEISKKITKDEMIEKIDTFFGENVSDEYRASVKKLFSPWKKEIQLIQLMGSMN